MKLSFQAVFLKRSRENFVLITLGVKARTQLPARVIDMHSALN